MRIEERMLRITSGRTEIDVMAIYPQSIPGAGIEV
jgi:hypothetical protein